MSANSGGKTVNYSLKSNENILFCIEMCFLLMILPCLPTNMLCVEVLFVLFIWHDQLPADSNSSKNAIYVISDSDSRCEQA